MSNDEMKNIEDVEPKTVEPGPGNNPVKRKVTAVIKQDESETAQGETEKDGD